MPDLDFFVLVADSEDGSSSGRFHRGLNATLLINIIDERQLVQARNVTLRVGRHRHHGISPQTPLGGRDPWGGLERKAAAGCFAIEAGASATEWHHPRGSRRGASGCRRRRCRIAGGHCGHLASNARGRCLKNTQFQSSSKPCSNPPHILTILGVWLLVCFATKGRNWECEEKWTYHSCRSLLAWIGDCSMRARRFVKPTASDGEGGGGRGDG